MYSDNVEVITILTTVTEILKAIEFDDAIAIDRNLKKLKEDIKRFEAVFQDNLLHKRY